MLSYFEEYEKEVQYILDTIEYPLYDNFEHRFCCSNTAFRLLMKRYDGIIIEGIKYDFDGLESIELGTSALWLMPTENLPGHDKYYIQ